MTLGQTNQFKNIEMSIINLSKSPLSFVKKVKNMAFWIYAFSQHWHQVLALLCEYTWSKSLNPSLAAISAMPNTLLDDISWHFRQFWTLLNFTTKIIPHVRSYSFITMLNRFPGWDLVPWKYYLLDTQCLVLTPEWWLVRRSWGRMRERIRITSAKTSDKGDYQCQVSRRVKWINKLRWKFTWNMYIKPTPIENSGL